MELNEYDVWRRGDGNTKNRPEVFGKKEVRKKQASERASEEIVEK